MDRKTGFLRLKGLDAGKMPTFSISLIEYTPFSYLYNILGHKDDTYCVFGRQEIHEFSTKELLAAIYNRDMVYSCLQSR